MAKPSPSRHIARPIIALVYDFDGTLSPSNMQEYTVLPKLGIAPKDFWAEVRATAEKNHAEDILTYMRLMFEKIDKAGLAIKREDMRDLGQHVKLFEGVQTWFDRINAHVEKRTKGSVITKHYVISAGLKEILEGVPIYGAFENVFASTYHYDQWGKATFVTSGFEFGNPDLTGFLGGVYVGGNFAATGLAVVGVELNADFANLSGHFSDINTGDAEQQWESALRLRLGIPVGNALLYGAVGVVVGGFEYHANGGGVAVFGYHRYAAGGTVGAGVEYALDSHLISRIEVRYNDFLDIHGALPGFVLHNDAWTAQVRGGVAYKY